MFRQRRTGEEYKIITYLEKKVQQTSGQNNSLHVRSHRKEKYVECHVIKDFDLDATLLTRKDKFMYKIKVFHPFHFNNYRHL